MKNHPYNSFGIITISDVEKLVPMISHGNWSPKTNTLLLFHIFLF